jgi:hypothetical protein
LQPVWPCASCAFGAAASHHRAALVRLEVAERDPAQLLGRNEAAQRVTRERKHLPQSGVKQQRLVADDEELIEGEARRRRDVRHEGREPIDAVGDFVDPGLHDCLHDARPPGLSQAAMDMGHFWQYTYVYRNADSSSIWMHILVQLN